jgi:endonuclease YncB( thermonuclease family)
VKEVKDGDTVTLEIRREITVRFLDCWCPESRKDPRVPAAKQEAEKQRGLAAKSHLAGMLKTGTEVLLQVPTSGTGDVAEVITMGRILGYVWPKNGTKSFSQLQVEAGHATVKKPEYLK